MTVQIATLCYNDKMLNEKDLDQIASLARVGIKPNDKARYIAHLNELLVHFDNLNKINVANLEETSWMGEGETRLREDVVKASLPVGKVLQNGARKIQDDSPEHNGVYFKVGRIIE